MEKKKKVITKRQWNEYKWAWIMIAPTIIGLMVLNIIPIFQTLYLSLFKSGAFGKGNIFVGLENYRTLFSDEQVWHAVRNTLVYLFYNNSFKYSNKGYGSAIVMLLLAIIMVITVIQNKLQDKWVNYM